MSDYVDCKIWTKFWTKFSLYQTTIIRDSMNLLLKVTY